MTQSTTTATIAPTREHLSPPEEVRHFEERQRQHEAGGDYRTPYTPGQSTANSSTTTATPSQIEHVNKIERIKSLEKIMPGSSFAEREKIVNRQIEDEKYQKAKERGEVPDYR